MPFVDKTYGRCVRPLPGTVPPDAERQELLVALMRARDVFEQLKYGDWRHMDATYVDQLIESEGLHGCDQAIAKAEGTNEQDRRVD